MKSSSLLLPCGKTVRMAYSLRKIESDDIEDVRYIFAPFIESGTPFTQIEIQHVFSTPDKCWVICDNNTVVGCAWIKLEPKPYGGKDAISIVMHSVKQRKGFAFLAISDILRFAFQDDDTDMVVAIVHRQNIPATKFVEKMKFKYIEPDESIGWPPRGMLDLHAMTRETFVNEYKIA